MPDSGISAEDLAESIQLCATRQPKTRPLPHDGPTSRSRMAAATRAHPSSHSAALTGRALALARSRLTDGGTAEMMDQLMSNFDDGSLDVSKLEVSEGDL